MMRRRVVLVLIALLGLPAIGCDDEIASSTIGVTVTSPVPAVVETLQDVRANAPLRQQIASPDRVIPFRRIRRGVDASVFTPGVYQSLAPEVSSLFAPASMAPTPGNDFAGLLNPTSPDVIPPDTMGAAGPNHFVSLLNSEFGVFDKSTGLLPGSVVTLKSFWGSLGTGTGEPASNPFDPQILYDQHSGRFIASSASGTGGTDSWLLIAVSSTSDPTGNWVMVAIDADKDSDAQQFSNDADFPGLGVDNANIYIAANMFNGNNYQYGKVWVIPKSQLLSGPPVSLTWTEFRDPTGSGDLISTFRPAHTFGTPGMEYFVYEGSSGGIAFSKIDSSGPGGAFRWTTLGSVTGVSPFNSTGVLPGVPQLGGSFYDIDPGDTRLLNAVYRNGTLWTTHHVEAAGGGRIEVAWYGIDPGSKAVSMQGRIGGRIDDSSRWYVYPSIAVNQDNDVAIGFSGSSASQYIGAYYTARKSTDPAGTMQPVSLLKSGESSYYKTFGLVDNRWGDYSATCVDPTDHLTFWTVQEYAESPSNTWGTWIGSFTFPDLSAPAAPDNLAATPTSDSQVDLSWVDRSSNERRFVIERKEGSSGSYAPIATLFANTVTYSDPGRSENTTYFYRVKAINDFGESVFNENSALTYLKAPTGLSATASSYTQIDLSWSNPSVFATRVLIQRKTGVSGTFAQIDNVAATGTAYSDNTVSARTTYYYRLKATSLSAGSLYSAEAVATTPRAPGTGSGGSGCAIINRKITEEDTSPLVTVLFLLSPLGVLAWLRRSCVPPRGKPGDP